MSEGLTANSKKSYSIRERIVHCVKYLEINKIRTTEQKTGEKKEGEEIQKVKKVKRPKSYSQRAHCDVYDLNPGAFSVWLKHYWAGDYEGLTEEQLDGGILPKKPWVTLTEGLGAK